MAWPEAGSGDGRMAQLGESLNNLWMYDWRQVGILVCSFIEKSCNLVERSSVQHIPLM